MWASSMALNGLIGCGKGSQSWSCHPIEHELSAFYDITHGAGLAIVTPKWMRHILNEKTARRFKNIRVMYFMCRIQEMITRWQRLELTKRSSSSKT